MAVGSEIRAPTGPCRREIIYPGSVWRRAQPGSGCHDFCALVAAARSSALEATPVMMDLRCVREHAMCQGLTHPPSRWCPLPMKSSWPIDVNAKGDHLVGSCVKPWHIGWSLKRLMSTIEGITYSTRPMSAGAATTTAHKTKLNLAKKLRLAVEPIVRTQDSHLVLS